MKTYPIFIKLENEPILIIGGGRVALQKAPGLIKAGAKVSIVSREFIPELISLAEKNKEQLILRREDFSPDQIKEPRLIIAATNNQELNQEITELAQAKGIQVNNATSPEQGDFFLGSLFYKGDFCLAAQTGGKAPGLSKAIIRDLEKSFGAELEVLVDCIALFRQELKIRYTEPGKRMAILKQLNYLELLDLLKKEGETALRKKLDEYK